MKRETDPDDGVIKEIVSGLRTTFKSEDFNIAEEILVAREASLKLEIARLRNEKQSILEKREFERIEMADLRNEMGRREAGVDEAAASETARAAEERLEKLLKHTKAVEEENESLVSEVSELRKKARKAEEVAEKCKKELKERATVFEANVAELSTPDNKRLRNSGVAKFSPTEPIEILDSDDDDCDTVVEFTEKESSPKVLGTKLSSYPDVSENKNDAKIGANDSPNGNAMREPQAPVIEPVKSPLNNENPVKEASSSNNGYEQLNTVLDQPQPALGQVGKDTGAKGSPLTSSYKQFWDRFVETNRSTGSVPPVRNK